MNQMTLPPLELVLLFPLLGFLINGIFGKRMPKLMTQIVGLSAPLLSLIAFTLIFFNFKGEFAKTLCNFFILEPYRLDLTLALTPLTSFLSFLVLSVGSLIHLYSLSYMKDDKGYARFFSYLNLFIFFMMTLVLSDNLLVMFIGWEGVGLASFLLIGFWFQKEEAVHSSTKAFIINRVGDMGFLIAIFLLFIFVPDLTFSHINSVASTIPKHLLEVIALCLFFGAAGKSAQIPLHVWLADAMTGPTPVSALIHAATMVTAGIFMIARLAPLYELTTIAAPLIATVGALTALLGALLACYETNLKKILAYSTVSQLGNMFTALGVFAFFPAIFHLFTHAFFKAALFLGAGVIIHLFHEEQDVRKMGGLYSKSKMTAFSFLLASLALAAFPFTSGFVSKEAILNAVNSSDTISKLPFILLLLTSYLTSFYIAKTFLQIFFSTNSKRDEGDTHFHHPSNVMAIPVLLLSLMGLLFAIPFFEHSFETFLHLPQTPNSHLGEVHFLVAALSVGGSLISFYLAYLAVFKRELLSSVANPILTLTNPILKNRFFFDFIMEKGILLFYKKFSQLFCWDFLEQLLIENGKKGVIQTSTFFSQKLRQVTTGHVQFYFLFTFIWTLTLILWCLYV